MSWLLLGALVLVEIAYPLAPDRVPLTVATVLIGFTLSVTHAFRTRGWRTAALLVAVTTGGGFAVEALGVATCVPFGCYGYSDALGPRPGGVSWVIPLAWTWMAWPAWLVAGRLATGLLRVPVAGLGLAAWDVFLDPQMVTEGYWTWADPSPALPGVPGIPVGNYLGWLVVAVLMMAALSFVPAAEGDDRPMYALYLWTYASSVLAHAVFLDLPGSAVWGGVVMGTVAVALGWRLWRS
jgi:uncharacterized membrane protein